MSEEKIIAHCVGKLKMSKADAELVAKNIYIYDSPDWSEWSWSQINNCFRGVLEAVKYVQIHGNPCEQEGYLSA